MRARDADGSAGDVNYQAIGGTYSQFRQPEPRIAARIHAALGRARSILNVGAGSGSYEPAGREVVAVEPSACMRAQRPAHLAPAIDAFAERLPFADRSFDASMATFTVHQWSDLGAGPAEMRRVTKGPVVILTCDPTQVRRFWLDHYAPGVLEAEARRYPSMQAMTAALGPRLEVQPVPIPLGCRDGFNEAYYGRPEMLLEPSARLACSAWSFVGRSVAEGYVGHLARDLDSGEWDSKHLHLRGQPEYDGSLRLIVA